MFSIVKIKKLSTAYISILLMCNSCLLIASPWSSYYVPLGVSSWHNLKPFSNSNEIHRTINISYMDQLNFDERGTFNSATYLTAELANQGGYVRLKPFKQDGPKTYGIFEEMWYRDAKMSNPPVSHCSPKYQYYEDLALSRNRKSIGYRDNVLCNHSNPEIEFGDTNWNPLLESVIYYAGVGAGTGATGGCAVGFVFAGPVGCVPAGTTGAIGGGGAGAFYGFVEADSTDFGYVRIVRAFRNEGVPLASHTNPTLLDNYHYEKSTDYDQSLRDSEPDTNSNVSKGISALFRKDYQVIKPYFHPRNAYMPQKIYEGMFSN